MVCVILGGGCNEQEANISLITDNNEIEPLMTEEVEKNIHEEMEITPLEYKKIDMADWKTYHNDEYGFEFKYPAEGVIFENTEKDTLISIKFAPENVPDKGFSAISRRLFDVSVKENDKLKEYCPALSEWGSQNMLVKIDENVFCYSEENDGAAGTVYHLYNYMYFNDDSIINLNFTIPEVNCGNYDNDDDCVPMNKEEETELFKQIISTFKIN